MMKKTLFALTTALAAGSACAAQPANSAPQRLPDALHVFLGLGLADGGDDLVNTNPANGQATGIKAGRGATVAVGIDYRITPQFSALASVGYQYNSEDGPGGKLEFARVPVELLGFYHLNDQWRVGGGLRYASSPKLSGDGVRDVDFDSTTSSVLEAEYRPAAHWGVQARYVHERYKLDGVSGKARGDQAGMGVRWYF